MCVSGVRAKEEKAGRGEVDIRRWFKMAMMLSTALDRWGSPEEECGRLGRERRGMPFQDGETEVVEEEREKESIRRVAQKRRARMPHQHQHQQHPASVMIPPMEQTRPEPGSPVRCHCAR